MNKTSVSARVAKVWNGCLLQLSYFVVISFLVPGWSLIYDIRGWNFYEFVLLRTSVETQKLVLLSQIGLFRSQFNELLVLFQYFVKHCLKSGIPINFLIASEKNALFTLIFSALYTLI